jgi:hypothetical protein
MGVELAIMNDAHTARAEKLDRLAIGHHAGAQIAPNRQIQDDFGFTIFD